jgi:hypothetical protein
MPRRSCARASIPWRQNCKNRKRRFPPRKKRNPRFPASGRKPTLSSNTPRGELARTSQAEQDVHDQLAAARSHSKDQSERHRRPESRRALQGEIAQLKRSTQDRRGGPQRSGEAKPGSEFKLLETQKQVASINQDRDAMQRERDDACAS